MDRPTTPLAPTAAELGSDLRSVLAALGRRAYAAVQLAASGPTGLRPRLLNASARRDLVVTLRRHELVCSGVDLWIPPAHFTDQATVDRAVSAVGDACELAADLGAPAVCIELDLERDPALSDTAQTLVQAATASGVCLAVSVAPPAELPKGAVLCVDPPRWLLAGQDPAISVADPRSVPRLCDLVGGVRSAPRGGGGLDVMAYRVACEVGNPARPVVADLRGLSEPAAALAAMERAWQLTEEPRR